MAVRNIRVIGDRMEPRRIYAGTRGSYITEVAFTFSGEWDGLTKKLIFYPVRGKPVYINYTYGSEKIPYEVMRYSGDAIMLMSGYSVEPDGSLGVKIVTASAFVAVDPAESDTQNEPDIPEATEFEKIVAKLGAPYIGENGNWFVWDVYTHEFVDTGLPARGEQGETGRGLTILGKYGSLEELRASVKDAQPGDAYAVGAKAPYTIYIWDEKAGDFTDHGDLRGVGITKIEQITDNTGSGEPNTIRIVTDDGAEYDYTVYNGERGHPGNIWIGETEPPDDSYVIWLNPGGAVSGFLESHQGTENAGRVLVVGEDGAVTTVPPAFKDISKYFTYIQYPSGTKVASRVVVDVNSDLSKVPCGFYEDPLRYDPEYKSTFIFVTDGEKTLLNAAVNNGIFEFICINDQILDFVGYDKGMSPTVRYQVDRINKTYTSSVLIPAKSYWGTAETGHILSINNNGYIAPSALPIENIARKDYVDKKTVTDTTLTVEGAIADAKAVGDKLAEKIPAPATASVGQTIKVSAVDENGKPTAWEAVDFPEGGGSSGGENWKLFQEGTTDAEVSGFEFDGVGEYTEFLFLGSWVKGSGNAGLRVSMNDAIALNTGNYFVHSGQDKNVSVELILMERKRFSLRGNSQQQNSIQHNIDGLSQQTIYTIPENIETPITKISFSSSNTSVQVPAGATYALYVR